MNVTKETPSDPGGLNFCDGESVIVLYGAICNFRTDSRFQVTNEYFISKQIAYFVISEFWTFGLQNLFVRTREPFFSNLRTFELKNLRTHEPSNLRTFGLMGCNRYSDLYFHHHLTVNMTTFI